MKFLIVDDHFILRQGLHRVLEHEFKASVFGDAADSKEALSLLGRERWSIAILDMNIDGADGLELLKRIKADYPNLPAIVFSMHPEERIAVRCLKAGAAGYVAKGSDSEQLILALRKALSGGRYVSAALAEKLAFELDGDFQSRAQDSLSNREFQVLRLISSGGTPTSIAASMSLSVKTVSTYRRRLLDKLKLRTTAEIIRYAIENEMCA